MNLVLAIIPVLLLIILMAFFKMSGDKSSVISLVVTMLIAFFGFHFPVNDLLSSFLYGALKAVSPILIIILMAIFSYNVLLKTEKMEIIKQQFSSISTDKSIQVLLLTWGFGGLLEAMAGFGTAVAIPAAILVSLGFKPVFSATVSLIANSVATAFGAIGTPVLVLAKETNLDVLVLSANVVLQLSVLMFLIPFVLLFLTDSKLKSLPKNIFLSLLVGGVSLGSQYIAARYMGAESPAIIGSILSIIVIVAYGKLTASKEEKARKSTLKGLEVLNAWSIYLLILFLIVLTSPLFPGLRTTLENNWVTRISLPINDSTMNYTVSWLTHAGVLLFVCSGCLSAWPPYFAALPAVQHPLAAFCLARPYAAPPHSGEPVLHFCGCAFHCGAPGAPPCLFQWLFSFGRKPRAKPDRSHPQRHSGFCPPHIRRGKSVRRPSGFPPDPWNGRAPSSCARRQQPLYQES